MPRLLRSYPANRYRQYTRITTAAAAAKTRSFGIIISLLLLLMPVILSRGTIGPS